MQCPCRSHAMPRPCRSESDFFKPRQSAAWERHWNGLVFVNQYRPS
jgi:hypothetical protein